MSILKIAEQIGTTTHKVKTFVNLFLLKNKVEKVAITKDLEI